VSNPVHLKLKLTSTAGGLKVLDQKDLSKTSSSSDANSSPEKSSSG